MCDLTIEYGLTRSHGAAFILFKKRGSFLHFYVLGSTEVEGEWSGEVGIVNADECLVAADALISWIRNPKWHPRGGREPFKHDVIVTNYGVVYRFDGDDEIYAEPKPETTSVTLKIETDGDAAFLADLFREMNRRLRGLQS